MFAEILEVLGDDAALIGLLECAVADLNGPFIDTDDPPDGEPDLPGPNGLLDGEFELGLVAELLNNTGAYADLDTGTLPCQVMAGLDADAVVAGFQANYDAMFDPIAPILPSLPALVEALTGIVLTPEQVDEVNALFPNLVQVLAGYATLGDDDSLGIVLFLMDALSEIIATVPTSPEDFTTFGAFLGPEGDADGDGFSNRQEYEEFAGDGPAAYVVAALDPCIYPGAAEGEGEGEGEGGGADTHTADWNGVPDNLIDLTELLRVIQFYNSGGFHCAQPGDLSDEGYMPGADPAAQSCAPHASDYNPQDWDIGLSELLRLIQFYNSGGYHPCPEGEDGFCPGPA